MNSSERIETFQRELSYIADNKLKEFAKIILENADDYFFTVPASSSGKYHPDFARGNGGLVRHTRAVTYFLNELIRPNIEFKDITRREGDLLIIAAIAHDIKKQGNNTGHTVNEHPLLGAEYVKKMWKEYGKDLLTKDDVDYIYAAVRSHMGPWCDVPPTELPEILLFYADYIASRKEIEGLTFISNDDHSEAEAYEAPVYTIDGYKFDFGKTKGMTIEEAYKKEPGYIKWMAYKEGFGNVEVQNLVREYVESL